MPSFPSPRAPDNILKVARTIADLGRTEEIKREQMIITVQKRSLD